MKTLAEWMTWLESRVSMQDECLVWKKSFNGNQPQASWKDPETGKKVNLNVRRRLWEAKWGKPPPKKSAVVCKCETDGCVHPDHLKAIPRSTLLGGKPISAERRLKLTLAARTRKGIKLNQEAVNDIRYGEGTQEEKAQRYGVSVQHVSGIVAQKWWRELRNPFAGLLG